MSIKRIATTAAAAGILAASAAHADPSDMAGAYIGAHTGWHFDSNADFDNGGEIDARGAIGGFQAGYNFLTGNVIWGLETDISLTGADPDGTCPFDSALSCDVDVEGLTTLRARLGYAAGDWLIYVTGGGAAGQFEIKTSGLAGSSKDDEGELGWTAGAGVEYLLGSGIGGTNNTVGLKLEYRYISMFDGLDIDATPTTGSTEDMDYDSHTVMVGLNWHF